jgi:hypothetical protein
VHPHKKEGRRSSKRWYDKVNSAGVLDLKVFEPREIGEIVGLNLISRHAF